ncbi:hypothetical protein IG631_05465 [Alternaria alternata]|nr:hypothetical protein IG631_05465 [Alternaria alternata]
MSLRHLCAAREGATCFSVVRGNRECVRIPLVPVATLAAYSAVCDARRLHARVMSFQACRVAWCNGNIFIRILVLSPVFFTTDKCDAHSSCSLSSLSTLVSNVK